ncbi:MAG: PASTA domain-containing protein [Candidatus Hydrogenedens sp.]
MDGMVDSADSSMLQRWLTGKDVMPTGKKIDAKSYEDYISDLKWLADAGSLSAESTLARVEKEDATVYAQLTDYLSGTAGSEKWVSVVMNNVSNIAGFSLVINFDKEYAEVMEVVLGDAVSNMKLSYNSNANATGSLKIAGSSSENIGAKGSLELLKVLFRMKQTGDAQINLAQVQINDIFAYVPMFDDPKAPKILPLEPPAEGEGNVEGITEGQQEGIIEGTLEGEGAQEGSTEGIPEGMQEGSIEGSTEGSVEGNAEGEGTVEGHQEGSPEGTPEGVVEGTPEGSNEGEPIQKVKVPDVKGKSKDEAIQILTSAGLKVSATIKEEYSKDVPKGSIIRTEPSVGTEVVKGTEVILVMSKGAKRTFIVSCGSGGPSTNSHLSDIFVLVILSFLLLTQNSKVRGILKNNSNER